MHILLLLYPFLCLISPYAALAETGDVELDQVSQRIQENMYRLHPGLSPLIVHRSPLEDFFEVTFPDGQIVYFHKNGQRFFAGNLVSIEDNRLVNITELGRNKRRKDIMDSVDAADMLVFSPPAEQVKAAITVFTDIDCGFCRKLHQEVPALNRLGIAVRYMAYPRSGIDTPSYDKFVSAWCANDALAAFTKAKLGQTLPSISCDNPVAEQFLLGRQIGVKGTPAIVYDDGKLHPGYMSAPEIAKKLHPL